MVTGRAHQDAVREQLPAVGPDAVLAEPSPRDSMAAIGLAAALLERADPDAVMGSFAADHVIGDPDAFAAAVAAGGRGRPGRLAGHARDRADVPVVGVRLHPPRRGAGRPPRRVRGPGVRREAVDRDRGGLPRDRQLPLERRHVRGPPGRAARPARRVAPGVRRHAARPRRGPVSRSTSCGPTLPRIALDHAIAEPAAAAGRVAVVPAAFGWDDVGDFDSLATLLEPRTPTADPVLGDAALVRARRRHRAGGAAVGTVVAVVGLDDVVVVDTPDALLVTTRAHAQRVKQVVTGLQQDGRADLT